MTDGMAWLAAPRSIAFDGHGVALARGLDVGELVSWIAATVDGPGRTARPVGELTGDRVAAPSTAATRWVGRARR
ncbi:hypothetical protein [Kitasatospora sp. NPDC088346]|uniref:hypothetical protein n=1 Tax=Kitasatospora sp. NPDC088346 TaxID=3364073 RepID=UPI0038219366